MSKLTTERSSQVTVPASSLADVVKVTDDGTAIIQNAELAKLTASKLKEASELMAASGVSVGVVVKWEF